MDEVNKLEVILVENPQKYNKPMIPDISGLMAWDVETEQPIYFTDWYDIQ